MKRRIRYVKRDAMCSLDGGNPITEREHNRFGRHAVRVVCSRERDVPVLGRKDQFGGSETIARD